jgi:hypothetical protein
MKLLTFSSVFVGCFFPSWIRIRDPGTPLNSDPDPQHFLRVSALLVYVRYCGADYNVSNASPCPLYREITAFFNFRDFKIKYDFYPSRIPDPGSMIQKQQLKRGKKNFCHTVFELVKNKFRPVYTDL